MEVAIRTPYHVIFFSQDTLLMLPKLKHHIRTIVFSRETMLFAR